MPKLPTYDAGGKLTTGQPEVVRTGAGQAAEAVGGAFDTVAKVTLKWAQAKQEMQNADLLGKQASMALRLGQEAEADPDVGGSFDKTKEMKSGTEALLEEVKNPHQRERLATQMTHAMQLQNLRIENVYRQKRMTQFATIAVPRVLSAVTLEKAGLDPSSPGWKDADTRWRENVKGWVKAGLLNPEGASELMREERIMSTVGSIEQDADSTLQDLQDENKYTHLTTEERQSLIDKAQRQIVENAKIAKAQAAQRDAQQQAQWYVKDGQAMVDFFNETLTPQKASALAQMGVISFQGGKAIAGAAQSTLAAKAKLDKGVYRKLVGKYNVIDDADYEAVSKWRTDVMAAYSAGYLPKKDAGELIGFSMTPLSVPAEENRSRKEMIGNALKNIRDFTIRAGRETSLTSLGVVPQLLEEGAKIEAEYNMIQHILNALSKEKTITPEVVDKATKGAIAEQRKKITPAEFAGLEPGDYWTAPNGIAYKVLRIEDDGIPVLDTGE